MKFDRRKFIKGMFAGVAMAFIPALPKIPEIPVEEAIPEVPEPVAKQFTCRDYAFRPTIQDYKPGESLKYQDLSEDPCCDNCLYEPRCLLSGQKFERYGDGTGRFNPKQFDKRCMNKLYQNIIPELKGGN